MASAVHFKFKSSKDFETLTFENDFISIADLKVAIVERKRLNCGEGFDLDIKDAQTGERTSLHRTIYASCSTPLRRMARDTNEDIQRIREAC
jgi:protein MPE1